MPKISIDTFESGGATAPLDSPRSLEAALRVGVDLDELYVKPLSYFIERAQDHKKNLAKVLLEHYEKRRAGYIAEVKAERKRIVAEGLRVKAERARLLGAAAADDDGENDERALILAQGKARVEAERKRMEFAKQKADEELAARAAAEKVLAEKALKEAEAARAKAEAMEEARKERERRAKKEQEAKRLKAEEKVAEEMARAEVREPERNSLVAAASYCANITLALLPTHIFALTGVAKTRPRRVQERGNCAQKGRGSRKGAFEKA